MKTLSNIQISPVLRFYLDNHTGKLYPYGPDFGLEQQEQFWQEQLAEGGLGGLTSVKKGSELVLTRDISDIQLAALLRWFLWRWYGEEEDILATIDWEAALKNQGYPASFDGGVILAVDEQIIVAPQCCVGLQDHTEWFNESLSKKFQRIWIGHPWIYLKQQRDQVLLTGLIEKEMHGERWLHYESADNDYLLDYSKFRAKAKEQLDEHDLKYQISLTEWTRAIKGLEAELQDFKARIIAYLMPIIPAYAQKIAQCLVEGNGEALSYDPKDI